MPSDISNSSIQVELAGTNVVVQLVRESMDAPNPVAEDKRGAGRNRGQRRRKAEEDRIPTTQDVAKSFLADEPLEEKRELEAAILSRSQHMQDSDLISDDGDTDSGMGTGITIALPSFLANFLQGIADRLEVTISDVNIELKAELDSPDASLGLIERPSASIVVHVEKVGLEGLTSITVPPGTDTNDAETMDEGTRLDKRRVLLHSLYIRLLSDPAIFSNLSRVPSTTSPVEPRSPQSERVVGSGIGTSSVVSASSSPTVSRVASSLATDSCTVQPGTGGWQARRIHSPAPNSQRHRLLSFAGSERFADVSDARSLADVRFSPYNGHSPHLDRDEDLLAASISTSTIEDQPFMDTAFEEDMSVSNDDRISRSDVFPADEVAHEARFTSQSRNAVEPHHHHSDNLASKSPNISSRPSSSGGTLQPQWTVSQSQPLQGDKTFPATEHLPSSGLQGLTPTPEHLSERATSPVSSSSRSSGNSSAEMSESKLYSHEDAESMYMSAFSEAPASSQAMNIPGGWEHDTLNSREQAAQESQIDDALDLPLPPGKRAEPEEEACVTPRPASPLPASTPENKVPAGSHFLGSSNVVYESATKSPPNQIGKDVFWIDQVSAWIPTKQSTSPTGRSGPEDLMTSQLTRESTQADFRPLPGSFSQYADTTTLSRRLSSRSSKPSDHVQSPAESAAAERTKFRHTSSKNLSFEMSVGSVTAKADMSVCRVLFQVVNQILHIMPSNQSADHASSAPPQGSGAPFDLVIKQLSLHLLEQMPHSMSLGGMVKPNLEYSRDQPESALLRVGLQNVRLSTDAKDATHLAIGKFTIGVDEEPMISFSAPTSTRSTASVKDNLEDNMDITYRSSAAEKSLEIMTLPLRIVLDVQKIDDALSCFGGLSGVLELSTSMSSGIATTASPVKMTSRSKGVRFAGEPKEQLSTPLSGWRVQGSFGGLHLLLTGRSCGVCLDTTTIRLIGRGQGIRTTFSKMRLAGPLFDAPTDPPPLSASLERTTLDFLFTPEETDLSKLVSLITPSRDKFEEDDDILLDTLLRQRKNGSLLRVHSSEFRLDLFDLEAVQSLQGLGDELSKLSNVAKYLPEDDRPGILTMVSIEDFRTDVAIDRSIGNLKINMHNVRLGHVGIPPLLALSINRLSLSHGADTQIVTDVLLKDALNIPMVMVRVIGDEMVPTIKVKLFNICLEYRVSTLLTVMGLVGEKSSEDLAKSMASSIATVTDRASKAIISRQNTKSGFDIPGMATKQMHLDLLLRECALGLNPQGMPSKALFLLSDTRFHTRVPTEETITASLDVRKASILIVDDVSNLSSAASSTTKSNVAVTGSSHVLELRRSGFVSIGSLSKATLSVHSFQDEEGKRLTEVDIKNDLFIMETCADSTYTLTKLLGALSPPTPPSTATQYRTKVMPMEEMMASFTGDAFLENAEDDEPSINDDMPMGLDHVGSFYNPDMNLASEEAIDILPNDDLAFLVAARLSDLVPDPSLVESTQERCHVSPVDEPYFYEDDYYSRQAGTKGMARKWDSAKNEYGITSESKIEQSPVKIHVHDIHFIWNLFDGYDWANTRQTIEKAVQDVESKAEERRREQRLSHSKDDEKEEVIGDFLFNSIWIEVPANRDPRELAHQINRNMDDLASETESYAGTTTTMSPARSAAPRTRRKRLRLQRSKHHKITFEVKGLSADVYVFPPHSGETQSSIDVRVGNLEIFDHVPSSTWRKFATYMQDAGEREMGKPMIRLELLNVKTIDDLGASEAVVRVTVLPLRLHVDQDALDFITRFFEFKDDADKDEPVPSDQPFLQRIEVNTVVLKLDYKPKKVDYGGLRSGHTTEFMNFFILDSADIILRHCIIYGVSGFDKLHKTLNDIWMPDVKRNQLPGVLAGLAPVRPIVNVGTGVRDLVYIPMREYKKDGRIVRSIQKGAVAFARTTTSELARLGAKLAIGTQNALQGAEDLLAPSFAAATSSRRHGDGDWDDDSYLFDEDEAPADAARATSHYADQPIGVLAGLRGAARSLERDLLTARDAIVAIPGEVMDSESAGGAARAIAKRAPTVILRPAIGASKAVGMTLLGAGNALDRESRRRIDDVSAHISLPTYVQSSPFLHAAFPGCCAVYACASLLTCLMCRNTRDSEVGLHLTFWGGIKTHIFKALDYCDVLSHDCIVYCMESIP